MSDSLWPHGLQHARLPCPSPTPRACSNSCPSSRWCRSTISNGCLLPETVLSLTTVHFSSLILVLFFLYFVTFLLIFMVFCAYCSCNSFTLFLLFSFSFSFSLFSSFLSSSPLPLSFVFLFFHLVKSSLSFNLKLNSHLLSGTVLLSQNTEFIPVFSYLHFTVIAYFHVSLFLNWVVRGMNPE